MNVFFHKRKTIWCDLSGQRDSKPFLHDIHHVKPESALCRK